LRIGENATDLVGRNPSVPVNRDALVCNTLQRAQLSRSNIDNRINR
jgi:hypothetical protein